MIYIMIRITDPAQCSGCTACLSICSRGAIKMYPDALGFLYPYVEESNCIDCGMCDKVCQFQSTNIQNEISGQQAFAARHKDVKEIEHSRSGAVFVALSDRILSSGGVVYGAGYDEHFRVIHKRAENKDTRDGFRGSKYVQSDLDGVFVNVRTDLSNGLKVLFSGTPCQTAGLRSFIGERKLKENLYLVDIVCHGVASPFVWRDYLTYLENKERDRIISLNFRDKKIFGWSGLHKESFVFGRKGLKTYSYTFYHSYLLRRSCNECPFSNLHRPSDLTLGDLWGWENVVPGFNMDDKGVSLVLCNSKKGEDLLSFASPDLKIKPVDISKCLQPNLQYPTHIDVNRMKFESDYVKHGFRYVRRKYGEVGIRYQWKRGIGFVKRHLKRLHI